MAVTVTREDILSIPADAAVVCIDNPMVITGGSASQRIAQAGGERLRQAAKEHVFLKVGSAVAVEPCGLPYRNIILCATPRWLTGKANELFVLHECYRSVYALAEEYGFHSLVMPFLSTFYYRFPLVEAVHIGKMEAEKSSADTVFVAETEELFAISQREYHRPEVVSYVGHYRDDAYFELDNGQYARVDKRPEITRADVIPFIEPCCRVGNNPLQPALPEAEILRLRGIYERSTIL